jgi:hypothetical protein
VNLRTLSPHLADRAGGIRRTFIHEASPVRHKAGMFIGTNIIKQSCYSSVGIALSYRLGDRGSRVRFLTGARNSSLHHGVQNGSGAHPQPPIQRVPKALYLGLKRPGRVADHSPPTSAEAKECVELYLRFPLRLHDVVLS